ncbi:MAG: antitoxin VapB family protein [Candidatus Woesearchaeota archaeon]
MATKTITIKNEAYERLAQLKMPTESFSDEIMRITEKKGSFMDAYGIFSDIPDEVWSKVEKNMEERRRKNLANRDKRLKELWR